MWSISIAALLTERASFMQNRRNRIGFFIPFFFVQQKNYTMKSYYEAVQQFETKECNE